MATARNIEEITTEAPLKAPPRNIAELREQLLDAFNQVRSDAALVRPRAIALQSMVAAAGCVIGSIKTELAYAALRGETVSIPFMDYEGREAVLARPNVTVNGYELLKDIHREIEEEREEA